MTCKKCGATLQDWQTQCPICNTPISNVQDPAVAAAPATAQTQTSSQRQAYTPEARQPVSGYSQPASAYQPAGAPQRTSPLERAPLNRVAPTSTNENRQTSAQQQQSQGDGYQQTAPQNEQRPPAQPVEQSYQQAQQQPTQPPVYQPINQQQAPGAHMWQQQPYYTQPMYGQPMYTQQPMNAYGRNGMQQPMMNGWGFMPQTMQQPQKKWNPKKREKVLENDVAEAKADEIGILTVMQCFITILLGMIPVVGIFINLFWQNSPKTPKMKQNMAKGMLIIQGIALVIVLVCLIVWVTGLWSVVSSNFV